MMTIAAEIEWRKDEWGKDRQALYLGDLCVGGIDGDSKVWRGWFHSDESGESVGWYTTADEARTAVENTLLAAIKAVPPSTGPVS